jgi:hypothetical protein
VIALKSVLVSTGLGRAAGALLTQFTMVFVKRLMNELEAEHTRMKVADKSSHNNDQAGHMASA